MNYNIAVYMPNIFIIRYSEFEKLFCHICRYNVNSACAQKHIPNKPYCYGYIYCKYMHITIKEMRKKNE
jgi:hypothetical protein